jgi:hypothetical protein
MATNWTGWAGAAGNFALAAATFVAAIPPIVGMFVKEPSVSINASNSVIQNYFLLWQNGAMQIAGIRPTPKATTPAPVGQANKPLAEPQKPNGSIYSDDLIKAIPNGASFDRYQFAQAGLTIENISGKDLLLAVEYRGVRAISNLGASSECGLDGLKSINGLPPEPDPLQFSRLAPNAKLTIGVTNCQQITPKDKPKSISINIPLLTVDNEKTKQFSIALNGILISQ